MTENGAETWEKRALAIAAELEAAEAKLAKDGGA